MAQFKALCAQKFQIPVKSISKIQLFVSQKHINLSGDNDICQLHNGDQIFINNPEKDQIFINNQEKDQISINNKEKDPQIIKQITNADSLLKLFLCPISHDIMIDPVMAADGFTYERNNIELWLQSHNTSPTTSLVLGHNNLTANQTLRSSIKDFIQRKASQLN
jgi:hypothetical protein